MSPFSPSGDDALTSTGQDGKPDEGFSSADLSLQQGSPLPPTRSMINPTDVNVSCLLSLSPHRLSFHSATISRPSTFCSLLFLHVSHLCHLKVVADCLLVHVTTLPPSRRACLSVLPVISVCCPTSYSCSLFFFFPSPWLHLHAFLSTCSLPSSQLIPHSSGSSHFHFSPLPYCVAAASHCWLIIFVGEGSEKVNLDELSSLSRCDYLYWWEKERVTNL